MIRARAGSFGLKCMESLDKGSAAPLPGEDRGRDGRAGRREGLGRGVVRRGGESGRNCPERRSLWDVFDVWARREGAPGVVVIEI